jgi:hypothetical protein
MCARAQQLDEIHSPVKRIGDDNAVNQRERGDYFSADVRHENRIRQRLSAVERRQLR